MVHIIIILAGTDEIPDWYINSVLYIASRLPSRHIYLYSERAMVVRNVLISDNGSAYRCSINYGLINSDTAILTVISLSTAEGKFWESFMQMVNQCTNV